MDRRDAIKTLLAGAVAGTVGHAQQLFRPLIGIPTFGFTTTATTFTPSFTKTGATLYWHWPDGTYASSNSPTKTLAAGTKAIRVQSADGFSRVTAVNLNNLSLSNALPPFAACTSLVNFQCINNSCSNALPSFATCTALQTFYCDHNSFSSTLPSFATCTALVNFFCNDNSFSNALPSFAACTALQTFYCNNNSFSNALPSFAACTALVNFFCNNNSFSAVVAGSFATQKSMNYCTFNTNALPAAAVNQVLADCVVSLGISGRVVCNLNLAGGTNAAPTGQGIVDKSTLVAAGWTVTTT
jgi:hypothetical protein